MIAVSYLLCHWPRQECPASHLELFASFYDMSIEVYYFRFSFRCVGLMWRIDSGLAASGNGFLKCVWNAWKVCARPWYYWGMDHWTVDTWPLATGYWGHVSKYELLLVTSVLLVQLTSPADDDRKQLTGIDQGPMEVQCVEAYVDSGRSSNSAR